MPSPVLSSLGALIAAGSQLTGTITWLGGLAIFITSINIFGGFVVTQRMLSHV